MQYLVNNTNLNFYTFKQGLKDNLQSKPFQCQKHLNSFKGSMAHQNLLHISPRKGPLVGSILWNGQAPALLSIFFFFFFFFNWNYKALIRSYPLYNNMKLYCSTRSPKWCISNDSRSLFFLSAG